MPEFVLNRKHTLRSTWGHIVNFEKGQPTYVPPTVVREAIQIGAEPVDSMEKTDEVLGAEALPEDVPLLPQERMDKITEAFEVLERANRREDFTASGIPTLKALEKELGFKPDTKERDEAWLAYKASKA